VQAITPVTSDQLLNNVQHPLIKFEIFCCGGWKNLSNWAGQNYVKNVSISLAGARVAPEPIAGTWSATLMDENAIFHPDHPTSLLAGWLRAGRRVMISVGATYGSPPVDYYWRRIVGYMEDPKFSNDNRIITLQGFDYAQQLTNTKLKYPDCFWDGTVTFDSKATENEYGAEKYTEVPDDAMTLPAEGEANQVIPPWIVADCTFVSIVDGGGGSANIGHHEQNPGENESTLTYNNCILNVESGKDYHFQFKYIRWITSGRMALRIYEAGTMNLMSEVTHLQSMDWTTVDMFFTATKDCNLKIIMTFWDVIGSAEFRVDQFSFREITGQTNEMYNLPAGCTGIYHVMLDDDDDDIFDDVPYGVQNEGWRYDKIGNRLYWDGDKQVEAGTNNLIVDYFSAQSLENVLADILAYSGLYDTQAEALAAMDYRPTGETIDRVWFKPGTSAITAIGKICERVNFRFYFNHNGTPVFQPAPTAKAVGFEDFTFHQSHLANINDYQNRNEIRNRIVIQGEKQDQLEEKDSAGPSNLEFSAQDNGSIGTYGEHTKSTQNDLFQDQAVLETYVTAYLADSRYPKWYSGITAEKNPVPLELGDTIRWQERLSAPERQDNYYGEFLYGTRLYGSNGIIVIKRGIIRDIKLTNWDVTYVVEKVDWNGHIKCCG